MSRKKNGVFAEIVRVWKEVIDIFLTSNGADRNREILEIKAPSLCEAGGSIKCVETTNFRKESRFLLAEIAVDFLKFL